QSTEAIESDDQSTRERFVAFCKSTKPAVEGAGGDHQTLATACMGRDFGLSRQTTIEVMTEFYNPRCRPPWDVNELERKVSNAYKYAQNSQGSKHPDNDKLLNEVAAKATATRSEKPTASDTADKKRIVTIGAADLMQQELPAQRWIVDRILPEGLTILA